VTGRFFTKSRRISILLAVSAQSYPADEVKDRSKSIRRPGAREDRFHLIVRNIKVDTESLLAAFPPKGTRQPALARARLVLDALYPSGVPSVAQLTNKELLKAVADKCKELGLKCPERTTILRATGRRK
jgi:hypothetical protein